MKFKIIFKNREEEVEDIRDAEQTIRTICQKAVSNTKIIDEQGRERTFIISVLILPYPTEEC